MSVNENGEDTYSLDKAIGFILRQVSQRHGAIFSAHMEEAVTAVQWAVLAKLHDIGSCSQNHLGRLTAMDPPTVKGVVERLRKRGYIESTMDPDHKRRIVFHLTEEGRSFVESHMATGIAINRETLRPLTPREAERLLELLEKLR